MNVHRSTPQHLSPLLRLAAVAAAWAFAFQGLAGVILYPDGNGSPGNMSVATVWIENTGFPGVYPQSLITNFPLDLTITGVGENGQSVIQRTELNSSGLKFSGALHRGMDAWSVVESYVDVYFGVDATTPYSLSGFFDVNDLGATPAGYIDFAVYLSSGYGGTYQMNCYSMQQSFNTLNESLVVGELGGDGYCEGGGQLTGELEPGRIYNLHARMRMNTVWGGPTTGFADGLGEINLAFSEVPEPSFVALLTLGFLGMVACKWRSLP